MMTREQMMNEVVRTLGFENKYTVWFFELAENGTVSDEQLALAMTMAIWSAKTEVELEDEE